MRNRYRLWRRRRAMRRIRAEFAFWGYPVDDLTDEQLEEGAERFARSVAAVGLTAEEAGRVLSTFTASVAHNGEEAGA